MTGREDCRVSLDSLPMESQLAGRTWEQAPFWHIDDAIAWIASPDAGRAHSLAAYRHFMGHPREPHLGLVGRSVASVARAEVSPDDWGRANAMLHEALRAGAVVAYGRSGDDPHGPIPASSWIEPMRLEYGASDHLVDRDGRVRFASVEVAREGIMAMAQAVPVELSASVKEDTGGHSAERPQLLSAADLRLAVAALHRDGLTQDATAQEIQRKFPGVSGLRSRCRAEWKLCQLASGKDVRPGKRPAQF